MFKPLENWVLIEIDRSRVVRLDLVLGSSYSVCLFVCSRVGRTFTQTWCHNHSATIRQV